MTHSIPPRRPPTTPAANTPERDEALRDLAGRFSIVAGGQPLDISVGAAALFVVSQADLAANPEFNLYVARKLLQVADFLAPALCRHCNYVGVPGQNHCPHCGVVAGT